METEFHRIKRLPPYVFAEVNAMKARARAEGDDIIDLGMGNPDQPTPQHIVDKLVEAARNPRAHRYSMSRGIPGLRKALAGYYQRRFNVDIDPETECIVTLGSKEGLANLAQAITSPGDILLVPNPSYPDSSLWLYHRRRFHTAYSGHAWANSAGSPGEGGKTLGSQACGSGAELSLQSYRFGGRS